MENKYYIGIDIGLSGAITILDKEKKIIEIIKTPTSIKDFADWIDNYKENSICMIEQVHSWPGNYHMASFSFGEINGITKTIIQLKNIPHYFVSPQKWMGWYNMKKEKDESENKWKDRLLIKSQQLFPENKIYKYMADSVLIANYLFQLNERNELK